MWWQTGINQMSTSSLHLGIEWSTWHSNLWRIITTSNNLKYIIELKSSIQLLMEKENNGCDMGTLPANSLIHIPDKTQAFFWQKKNIILHLNFWNTKAKSSYVNLECFSIYTTQKDVWSFCAPKEVVWVPCHYHPLPCLLSHFPARGHNPKDVHLHEQSLQSQQEYSSHNTPFYTHKRWTIRAKVNIC